MLCGEEMDVRLRRSLLTPAVEAPRRLPSPPIPRGDRRRSLRRRSPEISAGTKAGYEWEGFGRKKMSDLGYFKRSVTALVAGFRGVRRVGIALGGEKGPSYVGLHLHEVGAVAKQEEEKGWRFLVGARTGGGDVLALNVSTGQLRWKINDCHPGGVTAISFSIHRLCIYTAGVDGMVCQIVYKGNILVVYFFRGVTAVSFSIHRLCVYTAGVMIWDTLKSQLQTQLPDFATSGESGLLSEAKRGHLALDYTFMKWVPLQSKKKRKGGGSLLVLGTGEGDVLALNISTGQLRWKINDCHPGGVTAVSFSIHRLCVYTAGVDGMVCQIDISTEKVLGRFRSSTKAISSLSISSDGKILVTAAGQLKTFNCSNQKKIQKFSGHPVRAI
uniref:Uncharacterized protein n=1 Tax=Ananas comosus var. bracteatus TaxID=296719 RepID=A0A6V7QSS4_ANACO